MTINIESIQIVFGLPEWTSHKRFDKEITLKYSEGHAWAEQVCGYRTDNVISTGLFAIRIPGANIEMIETCLDSIGPSVTVTFNCVLQDLPQQVGLFLAELRKFLNNIFKRE